MKQTVLVRDHPFMRTILISAILLLSLCTTSFSANTDTQKTHFQNANNYTVKIRSRVEYPFLKDERGSFSGAGFLINRSLGWIATNAHVSASNPTIVEVAFKGHKFNEAKLIYVDHLLDLAVLRVPNSMIPEFAKQASLECHAKPIVGSPVGAYGHPFSLDYSGTRGIVSGNRYRWGRYWVQTDAAINSGNSGGPLINLDTGKVIGINSATYSKRLSEGLGFAVQMTRACRVFRLLERSVDPSPPYLPVSFAVNEDKIDQLIVAAVYAKQPVQWSLKRGDRIVSLAEKEDVEFTHQADLIHNLRGSDGQVELIVERSGERISVSVPIKPRRTLTDRIGVHASGIIFDTESLKDDEIMNPDNLLFIQSVATASIGALAGIKEWGYLASIDGKTITTVKELCSYLSSAEAQNERVSLLTRHVNWDYRAQTRYSSHELTVKNVKLVGPHAPDGCH
tara:strand:- start:510 stop:1865 length:1356 start_codon:yes stop_codon:yes gene_type:complete